MDKAVRAALALVLALVILAACGRSDDGAASPTTAPDRGDTACESVQPQGTDTGVTAKEIVIEVSADTGSPLAPGTRSG